MLVRLADGGERRARPFGRALAVVCGDQVRCALDAHHEELHVIAVLPRRNALYRTNLRGATEPVVANLTLLLVVLAPLPVPDFFVIDRYLAAATSAGIAATLVLNKSDLPASQAALAAELAVYARCGYAALDVLGGAGTGVARAARRARACAIIAALVGQSGVGKSSLVQRLVPEAEIQIGELVREEEGRHTTTASRMYELPGGGALIDSPGVRDFAPAIESRWMPRSLGFLEVERLAPGLPLRRLPRTCASRTARCARRWRAGRSVRAATRATAGCGACARNSARRAGRKRAALKPLQRLAAGQRVRQRAAIDVLEFPAHRHAVRDAARADAALRGQLAQEVRGRLALDGRSWWRG